MPLQEVLLGVEWRNKLDLGMARMDVLDRGTTALSFPDEQLDEASAPQYKGRKQTTVVMHLGGTVSTKSLSLLFFCGKLLSESESLSSNRGAFQISPKES